MRLKIGLFDPHRGGVDYVIKDLASDSFDPHSGVRHLLKRSQILAKAERRSIPN
ncbi:MAG: hypothetical protein ACI9R3_003224 [Verrucomicrobiales bacterium]|jgi:hypothetical protein